MGTEQDSTQSLNSTPAAASKPMGGSTMNMLVGFMTGISGKFPIDTSGKFIGVSGTPPKDPEISKSILTNAQISTMQKSIVELEPDRNSTYGIQKQVSDLTPNLETNTLIKPETKSQLKNRIDNLLSLVNQGIGLDSTLTALDAKASELRDKLFTALKARYSKKPLAPSEIVDNQTLATSIEERAKEANLQTRSFISLYRQITDTYIDTRRSLPGEGPLQLKPLNTITTPTVEMENQPKRLGNE